MIIYDSRQDSLRWRIDNVSVQHRVETVIL